MRLSDEAARKYIEGATFDSLEYERQHLIRLKHSAENAFREGNPRFIGNLVKTVSNWVEVHKETQHKAELAELIDVLNQIKEAEKRYDENRDQGLGRTGQRGEFHGQGYRSDGH